MRSTIDLPAALAYYKRSEIVFAGLEYSGLLTATDEKHLTIARDLINTGNELASNTK
ncbi:MAG: hypothetical protein KF736_01035 [Acidobacteria bacterium]|nr:hypothetical protein [Acidobacteriota bacterium]MCW5948060.1 hypothetical protein [Pyrinomonadaceae bacterium]